VSIINSPLLIRSTFEVSTSAFIITLINPSSSLVYIFIKALSLLSLVYNIIVSLLTSLIIFITLKAFIIFAVIFNNSIILMMNIIKNIIIINISLTL